MDSDIGHGSFIGDLAQNSDGLRRAGEHLEELLLDEGTVHPHAHNADLGAVSGQLGDDLFSKLGLHAAENDEDVLRGIMARILEQIVLGSQLAVESPEQLNNPAGVVKSLVERLGGLGYLVEDIRHAGLAQHVNDPQGFTGGPDAVVDVESGQNLGHQGGEESHMLRLVGRGARDET